MKTRAEIWERDFCTGIFCGDGRSWGRIYQKIWYGLSPLPYHIISLTWSVFKGNYVKFPCFKGQKGSFGDKGERKFCHFFCLVSWIKNIFISNSAFGGCFSIFQEISGHNGGHFFWQFRREVLWDKWLQQEVYSRRIRGQKSGCSGAVPYIYGWPEPYHIFW